MKFGIREITDIVFRAKDSVTIGSKSFEKGEPVIYFDSAKVSNMESTSTTVYAQGGRGNSRLLAWEGDKTATFNFEEALITPMGFSILSGAGLIEGSDIILHQTATIAPVTSNVQLGTGTASDVKALVLSGISAGGEAINLLPEEAKVVYNQLKYPLAKIFVYELDADGNIVKKIPVVSDGQNPGTESTSLAVHLSPSDMSAETTTFMLVDAFDNGTATTPNATAILSQDKTYLVDFYVAVPGSSMSVEAGKFAGYYYIEANTLFRSESTGKDHASQFSLPKGKIQSNFNFAMAATGDPSTFNFAVDAFPDKILGQVASKPVLFTLEVSDAAVM